MRATLTILLLANFTVFAQAQSRPLRHARQQCDVGKPANASDGQASQRCVAVPARHTTYLWALPLINTLGMKVGSEKQFGAGYNVLSGLEEAA